jgi:hypothetical protein
MSSGADRAPAVLTLRAKRSPERKPRQAVLAQPEARAPVLDAFPHTRRPLPWALAAFLAMLFFVPIDSTEVKVSLPVGSQPDRFAIGALVLAWIWFGGDQRAFMRTRRSKLYVSAVVVFLTLAIASLLLDAGRIINLNDFTLAEKRFALLGSFLILSWFTLTALRFEDVRGFTSYLLGLATMMSIGMIIERRTGYNIFYNWSGAILSPIAHVAASPTNIHPEFGSDGRVTVVGPTIHGLAATTMLVVVMPFALVRMFDSKTFRRRALYGFLFMLMLIAAASTQRKTALFVPVAIVAYLAIYRPGAVLRLAPLGLILLVGVVHFASPGSLGTIFTPSAGLESSSTTHREGDFTDVAPDVWARPLLGRGFGTLNVENASQFRINDDEYIDEVWEVGIIGLVAYLFMILAPIIAARRAILSRDPVIEPLALASSAGCVAYLVVNALFDAMSFPQAPYMFFIVAALATITASGPAGNVKPARERVRQLMARRSALAEAAT